MGQVTDPEILRQLNGGGAAPAAPTSYPGVIHGRPKQAAPPPQKDPGDVQRENTRVGLSQEDNARAAAKDRIGNPQDLRKEFSALPETKTYNVAVQQLGQALNTGEGPQADLALTYAFAKAMDPDSVVRDAEQGMITNSQPWFQSAVENVKKQFGMDGAGNFTPEARAALRQQIIRAVDSRERLYAGKRSEFTELANRNSIDPFEVVGNHTGDAFRQQFRDYDQSRRDAGANLAPMAGQEMTPPPFSEALPQMVGATGGQKESIDPQATQQLNQMVRKGAPLVSINKYLSARGMSLVGEMEYQQVRDYLKKNPSYNGSVIDAWKIEPISGVEQTITNLGDNAVGAYFANAGQFLTGNTLDNLSSDPEGARAAFDVVSANNPNAAALGQVSGGVMGSIGGEAAMARLGVNPGFARSLFTDFSMGAANGAGAADGPGQSRGLNALLGGSEAAAGNLAGNALLRGTARVVAPTGGKMGDVPFNPTPGQRLAGTGIVGDTINRAEQAMQSLPGAGTAIRSARQGARDEFQISAFNEALKEVGEQLPKGVKPGTVPHAYAQKTFDRVYAEARNGMTLRTDKELQDAINGMADDIHSLGPDDLARFKAIMTNRVNNKLTAGGGELEGKAYKKMISDLDGQISTMRKNPQNAELSEVLTNVKFALEDAARRHSDPAAVELLDAADAGYAKMVLIEKAAERRGGDAGTFTPKQFDAAVQKGSNTVRSRAYLRGDALMQEYADKASGLSDTVPDSGTAERLNMTTLGLSALMAPIGALYAPGVRKATSGALAPAGPKRQAIATQLRKKAALAGKAGAASAVALLPETSPGQ